MIKLMIRADDLGYSEGVNYGIAKSVKEGVIECVGVMTNMPAAAHGVELLRDTQVCYGQHTNICVGKPLTDPVLIPSITDDEGSFKTSKEYRAAKEDFVVFEEVVLEIEAQYKRFVELTGEQPRYFEGHAVASANFFKALEYVADKYGLKYSPFEMGGRPMKVGCSEIYAHMNAVKPDYNPYEEVKKVIQEAEDNTNHMFICHPGYLDEYILNNSSMTRPRPKEVEMAIMPATRQLIEESGVQLITYDDL